MYIYIGSLLVYIYIYIYIQVKNQCRKCRKKDQFFLYLKGEISKRNPQLLGIIKPRIIFNRIDGRKRYVKPITQKLVLRPTYLAELRKLKRKDEQLERKLDEVSQKKRKEDQ